MSVTIQFSADRLAAVKSSCLIRDLQHAMKFQVCICSKLHPLTSCLLFLYALEFMVLQEVVGHIIELAASCQPMYRQSYQLQSCVCCEECSPPFYILNAGAVIRIWWQS